MSEPLDVAAPQVSDETQPLDPLAAFVADPIQRRGFLAQLDQSLLDPDVQGWRTDTVRVLRAIIDYERGLSMLAASTAANLNAQVADREAKLAELTRVHNDETHAVDRVLKSRAARYQAAEAKLREARRTIEVERTSVVAPLVGETTHDRAYKLGAAYVLDKLYRVLTHPSTTTASEPCSGIAHMPRHFPHCPGICCRTEDHCEGCPTKAQRRRP
jgi:hypothetical protein